MNSLNNRRWHHRPLLGMLLMTIGLALYPLSDALIKHLLDTYSVTQTTFLRSLSRLVPLLVAVGFQGGVRQVFFMRQKGMHLLRLFVSLLYTYLFIFSFSHCSLTTVYTLSYTTSLFIVIFSAIFLRETVSKEKWIAVFLGLAGIFFATKPGGNFLEKTALLVLFATLLGALNKVLMRKLTKTEHSLSIAIYPNLCMVLLLAPSVSNHWQSMPWQDWGLCALVGVITAGGQYFVVQALRFAQASSLAPIDYTSFLWVLLLDFALWHEIPDRFTLIGAILIISSNLYILYCTRKQEKAHATTNDTPQ